MNKNFYARFVFESCEGKKKKKKGRIKKVKVNHYLSESTTPPMSRRSIRNVTSDKLDGASAECLSVKEKHTSNRRKVELLEHGSFVTFLEQMGHFVTNSI